MESVKKIDIYSYRQLYEELFVRYLEVECESTDCQTVYDRSLLGCDIRGWHAGQCREGLQSALPKFCVQTSFGGKHSVCYPFVVNWLMYIIIGAAFLGVIFLVLGFFVFRYLRNKKKNKKMGSKTGTINPTLQKNQTMDTESTGNTGTPTGGPTGGPNGAPNGIPTGMQTGAPIDGVQRY